MTSMWKWIAGPCVIVVLAGAGFVVLRQRATPQLAPIEPGTILTATAAEEGGTEPVALPSGPILLNQAKSPERIEVDFAFKGAHATYPYRLALAFAPNALTGTMDLGTPRGDTDDLAQFPVERRWSPSRNAYLVAVSHDLGTVSPAVPSLCLRAVIGPSKTSYDLSQASLCVMQRDQDGRCHAATLACGLIRAAEK